MKIGLLGGTFNPVHIGHTALASYVCNLGLVDEVWLMVSPQNPFKKDLQMLDEETRYMLVSLAVQDYPRLSACDFEFHLPRPSYTFNTLQELAKAFPNDTFTLIIGEDNWIKFSGWRNSAEILAQYSIIVYPRIYPGENGESRVCPDVTHTSTVYFLTSAPYYSISSTAIREAIAKGQDVSKWLDPAVYERIRELGLYGREFEDSLQENDK